MPGDNTRTLLKLFCFTESCGVFIEPSWKSWLVFCLLLLVSILLAASGVYFELRLVHMSAIFCFILSAFGFVVTTATLLAILLGYSRRRRVSNRNVGVGINDARPTLPVESVWLNIEGDLFASYRNAEINRQWNNPVYENSDHSLYETELEPLEYEVLEKRDFDIADGSSITRTWSHNGSPEEDARCRILTEKNDLSKEGEDCFQNHQDCGWMLEQKSSGDGRAESLEMVSRPTASATYLNASTSHQESNLDQHQVYLHHKMTSIESTSHQESNLDQYQVYLHHKMTSIESTSLQESNLDQYQVYLHHKMTSIESTSHQESNLDQHQVYLHHKMTSIEMPEIRNRRHLSSRNYEDEMVLYENSAPGQNERDYYGNIDNSGSCLQSNSLKQSNLVEGGGGVQLYPTERRNAHVSLDLGICKHPTGFNLKHDSRVNAKNQNDFFQPMDFRYGQLSSLEHEKDNHLTVVSMRNDYQSTVEQNCSSYLAKLHEECQNNNRNPLLRQGNQHTVINIDDDVQHHIPSRHALNFQKGFESHRYPDRKWSEHGDREHWKWSERNDYMRPIINKRPLLNADGEPISQYEFVKVLTKLLQNGLQQFPKHPAE